MTLKRDVRLPPAVVTTLLFAAFSLALYFDLLLGLRHFAHDTLSYNYPIRAFLSDTFRQGVFPWWDAWNSPGFPFALLQAERFYPPFLILGTIFRYAPWVLLLEIVLSTLWCLAGTHLWLKRQGISRPFALCGAMAYAGSGPLVTSIFSYPIQVSMFHIPWLFLAMDLLCRPTLKCRDTATGAALASISAWLMLTGGYITVTYMALLFTAIYAITSLAIAPGRIPAFLAGATITAITLVALLFLPLTHYLNLVHPLMTTLTQRTLGSGFSPFEGSLPPLAPFSLFLANASYLPDMLAGRAEQMYLGVIVALAVPTGLCCHRMNRRQLFFLVMALLVILLSWRGAISPLATLAVQYVPLLAKMRLHVFWNVLAVFFLVTAGCRDLTLLLAEPESRATSYSPARLFLIFAAVAVAAAALIRFFLPFENEWDIVLTPYDYLIFALGILIAIGGLGILHRRLHPTIQNPDRTLARFAVFWLVAGAVLLTTAALTREVEGFAAWLQTCHLWRTMPSVMFLMDTVQLLVIMTACAAALSRGVERRSAIALLVLATFLDLTLAAHRYHSGKPHLHGQPAPTISRQVVHNDNRRALGKTGVSIAFETRTPQVSGYLRFFDPKIAAIGKASGDGQRLLTRLLWFLPGDGPVTMVSWKETGREPKVESLRLALDSLTAVVRTEQAGILFWTDMWAPGWQATVNGQPMAPTRVMDRFKGVPLTPGRSVVVFRYSPPLYRTGMAAFIAALMLLLGLLCFGLTPEKRSPVQECGLRAATFPQGTPDRPSS